MPLGAFIARGRGVNFEAGEGLVASGGDVDVDPADLNVEGEGDGDVDGGFDEVLAAEATVPPGEVLRDQVLHFVTIGRNLRCKRKTELNRSKKIKKRNYSHKDLFLSQQTRNPGCGFTCSWDERGDPAPSLPPLLPGQWLAEPISLAVGVESRGWVVVSAGWVN